MSADNWEICPRCFKVAEAQHEARKAAVRQSYGVVSPEEFSALQEALPVFIGADDGVVQVSYSGRCGVCALALAFKDSRSIPGVNDLAALDASGGAE